MKATIFGAGNIGRGLVGVVLASGYELTFVDANTALIEALQTAGTYDVVATDGSTTAVAGATYVAAQDHDLVVAAVAESDIVATAVSEPILKVVAKPIGEGLALSTVEAVNVLACENIHPNSPVLAAHISALGLPADKAGFPEVIVDRIANTVPDSLELSVEPDYEFIVDGTQWRGEAPAAGVTLASSIAAYEKRKLWLVNGLHVAIAVLGSHRGYTYIHDAIADPDIKNVAESVAASMTQSLEAHYPTFDGEPFALTAATSLARFTNAELADPVTRVARNLLAKLGSAERIVGPLLAANELGLDATASETVISHALALSDGQIPGLDELTVALEAGPRPFLASLTIPEDVIERIISNIPRGETHMLTQNMTIANPSGLHARPASTIVEALKSMTASVEIHKGEKKANGASIMSVLALGATTGDEIIVTAEGDDAEAALAMIHDVMSQTEEPSA